MPDIKHGKIPILATDGFARAELTLPYAKLSEVGATVTVAAPQSRQGKGRSAAETRPIRASSRAAILEISMSAAPKSSRKSRKAATARGNSRPEGRGADDASLC